jgi:hypothetical protein
MPTKTLSSFAKEDAKQKRLRAHGDRARRVPADRPIADTALYVRLPQADLVWLKVYAAQQRQPMTAIAQQIIHEFRTRVEGDTPTKS